MQTQKFKRAVVAAALSASLFLSRPVLADEYSSCRYVGNSKRIEYTVKNKVGSASVREVVGRFGPPLSVSCNEQYTIMLLENAIVRVAGGKHIMATGDSAILDKPTGRYKVADFLEYEGIFGPQKAKKVKIEWGKVAVVATESGTLFIYKGLQSDSIFVAKTDISEFNISALQIEISGSESDTVLKLSDGKKSYSARIIGLKKDELKIIQNK